jgi:hypothetical protein
MGRIEDLGWSSAQMLRPVGHCLRVRAVPPKGASVCRVLIAAIGMALFGSQLALASDDSAGLVFFESKIRPVLVEKCHQCHSVSSAPKPKGGLVLDNRAGIRRGGNTGPAVVPGDIDASLLYQAISGSDDVEPMPPKGKLSAATIADFRRWIKMGAPDPRESRPSAANTASTGSANVPAQARGGAWWSLRPLQKPAVPALDSESTAWARTPVDAFVLAKLREHGLRPSVEADRRALVRRLSFDLLGLPPAPADVESFQSDKSPDAYERLVDRLLASPQYGERWARHWMDVVHFAETHGHDQDRIRSNAWPYRDYLIASFNRDTPYSRFVEEQIAADAIYPDEPRLTVALGMIAAGPWDESSLRDIRDDSIDRQIGFYIDRDDMVATVISTFSSVTIQCARCHEHKFDPISQDDYYSLQAVFAGVDKAERGYDADPAVVRLRQTLAGEIKNTGPREAERAGWLKAELAALPPQNLVFAAAAEFEPDAGHKAPGAPRPVHVLRRGDIHQPGKAAAPGTLSCIAGLPSRFALGPGAAESARRAALARWITDSRNPLTWRSIVNRVWHYHFGRGLVATPNDFGRMGASPSHPELLDWLAATTLECGGSIKTLHRLIVSSAVYRQSVPMDSPQAVHDADNIWLWRQNRRRLDAESIHDAILMLAGRLDQRMGGPSVQQFRLSPGVHVTPVVDYAPYDWESPGACRRSVYRFLFRTLPDPFFDTLDSADASQLTAVRNESTTPLQALALLNNQFVIGQCGNMARRFQSLTPDARGQARALIEMAYARPGAPDEVTMLADYAVRHGLENLCRLIVNSNEFLFVN